MHEFKYQNVRLTLTLFAILRSLLPLFSVRDIDLDGSCAPPSVGDKGSEDPQRNRRGVKKFRLKRRSESNFLSKLKYSVIKKVKMKLSVGLFASAVVAKGMVLATS